jgi:hypothetical protein
MKVHPAIERPTDIGMNPEPLDLFNFVLWKFLQMSKGGLYAKWDENTGKGIWFYSQERDFMFREPRCDSVLYEEQDKSRFRSLIFRFGSLSGDGLCGFFEFQNAYSQNSKKFTVHASFYPESKIGLWIAIVSRDEESSNSFS